MPDPTTPDIPSEGRAADMLREINRRPVSLGLEINPDSVPTDAEIIASLRSEVEGLRAENLEARRQMIGLTEHGGAHLCRAEKAESALDFERRQREAAEAALSALADKLSERWEHLDCEDGCCDLQEALTAAYRTLRGPTPAARGGEL